MYKDVKKKLLAVVLSVCMVIGVVEIVPRVRAAAQPSTVIEFQAKPRGGNDEYTVRLTVNQTIFTYDGQTHIPTITDIKAIDSGAPGNLDSNSFTFAVSEGKTDAGEYKYEIVAANSSAWILGTNADKPSITFKILPKTLGAGSASVSYAGEPLSYTGSEININSAAIKENVSFTIDKQDEKLTNDQFTLTGNETTEVGVHTATVNFTQNANYEMGSGVTPLTFNYVIAYDLGAKPVGFTVDINQDTWPNGGAVAPAIIIDKDKGTELTIGGAGNTNIGGQGFQVKYYRINGGSEEETSSINRAGQYKMTISPVGNYAVIKDDGRCFKGSCSKIFSVGALDNKNLRISAYVNGTTRSQVLWENGAAVKPMLQVPFQSPATTLRGVVVEEKDATKPSGYGRIDESKYNVRYEDNDQAGEAYLIIDLSDGNTDYEGEIRVPFYISSDIFMETIALEGKTPGDSEITYDGKPHSYDASACVVKATNAAYQLIYGTHYTLSAAYYDGAGWVTVKDTSDPNLATVGDKRIIITGMGAFAGQTNYADYKIMPIDLDDSYNRGNCRLEISPRSYPYTGSKITPSFKFTYKFEGASDYTEISADEYTADVTTDGVNAGEQTLTLDFSGGKNFRGTYSGTFEITALQGNDIAVGQTVYDGSAKTPALTITQGSNTYTLLPGRDYDQIQYKKAGDSTAQPSDDAPVDAGTYDIQIHITNANIRCAATSNIIQKSFVIQRCDIKTLDIHLDPHDPLYVEEGKVMWDGGETRPNIFFPPIMQAMIDAGNADFSWDYADNNHVSVSDNEASVTIDARSSQNFSGTKTINFTIISRDLSSQGLEFTMIHSGTPTPGYTLNLNARDANTSSGALTQGTDYTVKEVKRYRYEGDKGEKLVEGSGGDDGYTVSGNTITGLKLAGKYEVTIVGKGSYTGEATATEGCGRDISAFYTYISSTEMGSNYSVPYNGTDRFPKNFVLKEDKAGTPNVSNITYSTDPALTDFTVEGVRQDGFNNDNYKDAGTIYVRAIGNPKKGFYGRTDIKTGVQGYSYTITKVQWSYNVNFKYEVENVTYAAIGTARPVPVLYFKTGAVDATSGAIWERLEGNGIDYEIKEYRGVVNSGGEISYNKDLQNWGSKQIVITPKGNFNGVDFAVPYSVLRRNIDDPLIKVEPQGASFNNLSNIQFIVTDETSQILTRNVDYRADQESIAGSGTSPVWDAGTNSFYVNYTLTGLGNYTGTRKQIRVDINMVNLNTAIFRETREETGVGEYYVQWDIAGEHLITSADIANAVNGSIAPKKPQNFQIIFRAAEDYWVTLIKEGGSTTSQPNYRILTDSYGSNNQPGRAGNTVTIRGIDDGGYTGDRTLQFPLYTDISGAEIADNSLIKKDGTITKSDWIEFYEDQGRDNLLTLKGLWFEEGGRIDPSEYNLKWDPPTFKEANPVVRDEGWTAIVEGTQKGPHYYYGTIKIPFKIVNSIKDTDISVGSTNSLQYKGADQPISKEEVAAALRITTKEGQPLVLGTHYEVVSVSGTGNIGEAIVTIRGLEAGNYSGETDHPFKITYSINSLVIFIRDPETNSFVNEQKKLVSYSYTGSPVEPDTMVFCPEDFANGKDTKDEEYLADTGKALKDPQQYTRSFTNNTYAGTGTIVIKSDYFTDSTSNAQRSVNFSIGAGNIRPPSAENGGTVEYTSSKYPDAYHIVATYTGDHFTVESLGIKLTDKGKELKENTDYVVHMTGDTLNVSDQANPPVITFTGVGNYAGSSYPLPFRIVAKSLAANESPEITADDIQMTYTDQASEQSIINRMNVRLQTPTGVSKKLMYGTDFEILGYYNDAFCTNPVQAANGVWSEERQQYIPAAQGTYYARISGVGNFTKTREIKIEIAKQDLTNAIKITFVPSATSDCLIDNSGEPDCTYNGREHKPAINVTYGTHNVLLQEQRDYTVIYEENINAGTAKVIVKMTPGGNYDGEFFRTFTIKQKSIEQTEGGTILYSQIDKSYKFKPNDQLISIKPPVTIRDSEMSQANQELTQGKDYDIKYQAESADIEKEDGAPECSYGGKVVIVITGIGNYSGTHKMVYYIGENIGDAYVQVNGSNRISTTYNGLTQLIPESSIQVRTNSNDVPLELPDGTKCYGYAYYKGDLETLTDEKDIVDAGTYYIAVTGNPRLGTYAESTISNSCVYTINQRSIAQSYILVSGYDSSYYYTGQAIEPKAVVVEDTQLPADPDHPGGSQYRSVKLVNGVDYDISYSNNTYAGKATIQVTGKGNYGGTRDAYFTIISSDSTGNNTGDGTSEGSGSMSNGTTTIYAKDIVLGFSNSQYNCMLYDGSPQTPHVSINGITVNDFIVTARNNIAPGVATLEIRGAGTNYTGTIYKDYLIKADLSRYGTILGIPDQTYTGYQITPSVTLTCGGNLLNQGSDYTVTYANNTNVGRATVMAHAAGNSYYIGTATSGFNISNAASGMQVTGYASAYTYTGYAITPDVVVTMNDRVLNRGTDYTVSYANNINVGTASMTVTGLGSYSGSRTINFTIEAKNIENCLTTEVKDYQYNGSTYTPVITVTDSSTGKTLVAGTDYTITYSNNTNPGTAQITVTALSKNYTGTKVIPFQITSAAVSGLRTSTIKNNSIKLAWSNQEYADGYQICNSNNRVIATTRKNSYTVKGLTSCTTYKFKVRSYVENPDGTTSYGNFSTAVSAKTLLNTPKLTAKASGGGRVTLTWTKVTKATGYEIYYSTSKNGLYSKLKTVSKSSKRRYVDRGLARGEKYYYTIRAYRTTNGVKTYSNYNTIKSVKVK